MTATAAPALTFSPLLRHHITTLADQMSREAPNAIRVTFGKTDDGQEWALWHTAADEPLATIFAGAGTAGGHVVLDAAHGLVGSLKGSTDSERLMRSARNQVRRAQVA
ncbi:MAG: hypothetical protein INR62_05715 [Rhodospirillales bacterium]|nr:hypothetical protein [Acetobacter sp.]